jgi:hypothetical protein
MAFTFFTHSDLVEVGRTEDGEMVVAESHYVVAEAPNGSRWAHDHRFVSLKAGFDDEYGISFFTQIDAVTQVEAFLVQVEAARAEDDDLDAAHWASVAPAYGSAAHDESWLYDDDDIAAMQRGR